LSHELSLVGQAWSLDLLDITNFIKHPTGCMTYKTIYKFIVSMKGQNIGDMKSGGGLN